MALTGLLEQGKDYMRKSRFNEAERSFRRALDLSLGAFGEAGDFVGVFYYSLGQALALKGERNKAREPYLRAYEILGREPEKNAKHLFIIERDLGVVGQEFKMKIKDLEENKQKLRTELNRAISEGNFENNAKRIGNLYNSLGSLAQQEGVIAEGISYKQKALEWLEREGVEYPSLVFFVHLDLAIFYRDSGNHREALQSISNALALVENDNSDRGALLKFVGYHNMGKVFNMMKEHEKAVDAFKKAIEVKETSRIRDAAVLRRVYTELAISYFILKRIPEAVAHFERALTVQRGPGDERFTATVCEHIGKCHLLENNIEKSKNYYQKAYNLRSQIQGKDHPDVKNLETTLKTLKEAAGAKLKEI